MTNYDFNLIANNTNFVTILKTTNTWTDGLFGIFLLTTLWLIVYFGLRAYEDNKNNVVTATFVIFIAGFLMRTLGMINNFTMGALIVLMMGSLVMLINRE